MLASMLKPEEPWATPVPCSRLIPITLQQTQDGVWAAGGWSTPSPQVPRSWKSLPEDGKAAWEQVSGWLMWAAGQAQGLLPSRHQAEALLLGRQGLGFCQPLELMD